MPTRVFVDYVFDDANDAHSQLFSTAFIHTCISYQKRTPFCRKNNPLVMVSMVR
jgi:hypothetical protein